MAGKHEPPSKRSFWISLTASTLKVAIVIGAVFVGVVVLANAFESQLQPTTAGVPTPTPSKMPKPDKTRTPPDPSTEGAVLGIYNGTDVSGLANKVERKLRSSGGFSVKELGNTVEPVDSTTIYFVKARDESLAQAVQASQPGFADADVLRLPKDTEVVPVGGSQGTVAKGIQVVVFIGEDYDA